MREDNAGPYAGPGPGKQDLRLDHLWVVYPGNEIYRLNESVTVIPISAVPDPIAMLDN